MPRSRSSVRGQHLLSCHPQGLHPSPFGGGGCDGGGDVSDGGGGGDGDVVDNIS